MVTKESFDSSLVDQLKQRLREIYAE